MVSLPGRELIYSLLLVPDFTAVGRIEGTEQMEQRAFAGSALADDCGEFASRDFEVNTLEYRDFDIPFAVALLQAQCAEGNRTRNAEGHPARAFAVGT
jgi:hypothetical protein